MKCYDNKPASQSYQFLDKLGEGSFGYIWKVKQISTGQIYACKLVKNSMKKEKTLLQREIKILHLLKGKKGFSQLITSGQDHKNTYFIMNLLGDNLEQVRIKYGKFDTTTILNTGQQMILLLKELHNANIIHRDIKPENFVVHQEKVHLIDFGLSKLFIQDGKHLEFRENKGMIGTARYASINSLKGNEQSRRDDLESVGYLLIYLFMGTLPWNNIMAEDKNIKYYKIQRMKEAFKPETYINLPPELSKYMEYVKRLKFDQKPDYDYLENMFKRGEDFTRSPKLQIQQSHLQIKSNLLHLKSIERTQCLTSRKLSNQLENTSRRITFEDLSSAGADIIEELDKDEGIKLKNLSVGIKQPQVINRINKVRTGSDQIFEIENKLMANQLPISLKQLE
ncbi:unnamed protein product [Paramecium pentaurelia]|uniref:Casein kinase I n=1 Tax=Paramecium pentaurelia TaxID=43138 RepID=A0A8S1WN50_9CILI|nr:unnamed protein product [Paramecium pentaurelia]